MRKPKDINTITLQDVKGSDCGCSCCLWLAIECKNYEKFSPKWSEVFKQPSCENYTYCD